MTPAERVTESLRRLHAQGKIAAPLIPALAIVAPGGVFGLFSPEQNRGRVRAVWQDESTMLGVSVTWTRPAQTGSINPNKPDAVFLRSGAVDESTEFVGSLSRLPPYVVDMEDPATPGLLLALLREALNRPRLCATYSTMIAAWVIRLETPGLDHVESYDSELDVIVEALGQMAGVYKLADEVW